MKKVIELVGTKKAELQESAFCDWMKNLHEGEDPFSFVPAMSFFVLGFRDILALAKRPLTGNPWDAAINLHCDEDKNHWLWFIHDLEHLGFKNHTFGPRSRNILRDMWSNTNRPVRDMVYMVTQLVQAHRSPMVTLAIIESLEAAFGVFIEVLRPQVEKHSLYEDLKYFGRDHDEGEQSHALGNWVDGVNLDDEMQKQVLPEAELREAILCVNQIFAGFDNLFHLWFENRGRYQRYQDAVPAQLIPATLSTQELV
jgi:hypothetical protein